MNEIRRTMSADALRHMETLSTLLFQGEALAHKFIIKPVEGLSFTGCSVSARMIRPDCQRVDIADGALEDGNAALTLTAACYAVAGPGDLFIYVNDGTRNVCVYACHLTVVGTEGKGDQIGEPPIIQAANLADWIARVEARLSALEGETAQ